MADKIQLEAGLELWKVPILELKEQDLNARSMSPEMFERLSETIGRDKRLEALPFCALTDEGLQIISGHHRVRAAITAEVKEIYTIVDVTGLTKSQIKAKQLAHNSISGIDDASLLQQIYEQIETVEDMREAFVDIDILEGLKNLGANEVIIDVETKSVYLAFLPEYFDRWNQLIESQEALVDQIAIAEGKLSEKFRGALQVAGKIYDIRSVTPLICKFIELADGLKTEGEWVSVVDILGARMPKSIAERLSKVIEDAIARGDVTEKDRWQILDKLLALIGGA